MRLNATMRPTVEARQGRNEGRARLSLSGEALERPTEGPANDDLGSVALVVGNAVLVVDADGGIVESDGGLGDTEIPPRDKCCWACG